MRDSEERRYYYYQYSPKATMTSFFHISGCGPSTSQALTAVRTRTRNDNAELIGSFMSRDCWLHAAQAHAQEMNF